MRRFHGPPGRRRASFVGSIVVLSLLLIGAACSGGGTTGSSSSIPPSTVPSSVPPPSSIVSIPSPSPFPVTIVAANGSVTIDAKPTHIVSLSPTATEMLFAMGAGPQVVAVDAFSNYPPEAPTTDLSGVQPNVEAIATYQPDLVVIQYDPGHLIASLTALDIPVLEEPSAQTLDDAYVQIEQLGAATGNRDEADQEVVTMRSGIDQVVASLASSSSSTSGEPLTYYHELDDTYFSVTSSTFVGQVYALLGLQDIADQAKDASSGYPQLSAEYILDADPDLIFLADTKCCGQSAATVADRPGWGDLSAVRNGSVIGLDDDIASRWGPRVVDFLRVVADAVASVRAATG
jgi:iron complex transport system substrate-binding protein